VGRPHKKWGKNTKKTKISSPSAFPGTRGRASSPSARARHSGKRCPSPSASPRLSGKIFLKRFRPPRRQMQISFLRVPVFPECCTRGRWSSSSASLHRVSGTYRHSGKPLFPECNSSPSATLGEEWLPRVPDFWHSGKYLTLGESCFSRRPSWLSLLRKCVGVLLVYQCMLYRHMHLVMCTDQ
jgi:hypothetical protein